MLVDEWLLSGIRISLPLLFAALGGMLSERAGIANIALEAFLLFSSFTSAAVMAATHSMSISLLAGILAAVLIGAVFSFFTVNTKSDQIIVGMALNILASGIIPVLCKAFFGSSGQTPSLSMNDRIGSTTVFITAAVFIFALVFFIFKKTAFGLRIL